MSEYEKRIFKTLTASEEKFKSALEIAGHVSHIKKRLITQFWQNVEKELVALVSQNNEDFKVALDKDIFHKNSKCFLYLENNKKARILYEHLADTQSFGLWIENPEIDMVKIKDYIETQGNEITDVIHHPWWVSFQNTNENFNGFDSLLMLLPENSIEYSKTKAQKLFDFAVEHKKHLKYIVENCTK